MTQQNDKKPFINSYNNDLQNNYINSCKNDFKTYKAPSKNSYNNSYKNDFKKSNKNIYKSDFKSCYIIQVKKIRSTRTATNNKKIKNIFEKFFNGFHKSNVSSYIRA